MSLQPTSDYAEDKDRHLHDEPTPVVATADPADQKAEHKDGVHDRLEVPFVGSIRAPSPDRLSILSLDEYPPALHTAGPPLYPPTSNREPPPPDHLDTSTKSFRGRILASWVRNKGLCLVLVSQIFGVLMNMTTRVLEVEGNHGNGMHPFQILFARMTITLLLSSLYVWWVKIKDAPFGPKEVRWLLALRGFGGFFGVFGIYYSLLYLPLADATVITFLSPSLACFACSFLINEPFTRMEKIAALISLVGVGLIARPTFLFTSSSATPLASGDGDLAATLPATNSTGTAPLSDAGNYDHVTPAQRALGVGVGLVGVLGSACAYTTLRWIGMRAHALISVNYFAAWCTIVSTVAMLALPSIGFLLPSTLRDWGLLIFLGLCGFVMQFLLASGLQYERSSRATNMVYCQMLFALAGDKVVFGTDPGLLSIAGSSLILGSAIYVAVHKEQAKSKKEGERVMPDEERGLVDGMEGADEEREAEGTREEEVELRTMRE